jgi:hypothetical protein
MEGFAPKARAAVACPNSWSKTDTKTMAVHVSACTTAISVSAALPVSWVPKRMAMIQKLAATRTGTPKSEKVTPVPRRAGGAAEGAVDDLAMGTERTS